MESKKDIGKAFREKLDQLHKQPGDAVWDSIKNDLSNSRRKTIPVWLRLWTITGVFIIAAFFTYPLWENKVPRIYIKMPDQENEQVTGTTHNDSESTVETGITIVDNENAVEEKDGTAPLSDTFPVNDTTTEAGPSSPSPAGISAQDAVAARENSINRNTNSNERSGSNNTARVQGINKQSNSASQQTTRNSTAVSRKTSEPTVIAANTPNNSNKNSSARRKKTTNKNNSVITKTGSDIVATDDRKNTKHRATDEETDEGFIVPMSAAYQNYRNNIARGIPADTIATDSTETGGDDFAKVTDSLRKIQSTGVQDALKVPPTKLEKEAYKNFYVYGFSAPTKYALAENGEYIDASLSDKNTSAESSLAYGAYFGYNINPKLSIRAGAIKSKVGLTTNNIYVASPDFEGIEYNPGVSNTSIAGQMNNDPSATLNIRNNFEFIEVPVEFTYSLYESKVCIGVLGGFITRFTTNNTVFAENETGSMQIGKIKSLKDINNGVSLGGSFHYDILPSLQLNAEPVYKYFFNKGQFIEQHTFSIQAGLQYNF